MRAMGRIAYRLYAAIILGGVVITALLAVWPGAVTAVHTAAFAAQTLPSPVKIQPWLAPEPRRTVTMYPAADGSLARADIYVIPDGISRAGALVFLGANAAGADDPDVVNLGHALARAGFAVMYHWSPELGGNANIDPSEIPALAAAFEHLRAQDFTDPQRIGLAGFSVGASLALVAAGDARIAADVAFVNAFGGYYDAGDLLVQIAAGRTLAGEAWTVDPLTRRVFENEVAESGSYGGGAAILSGPVSLAGAQRWYADTPAQFRRDAAAVSPSRHLEGIAGGAVIRLMHDRGDALIPVGESRRLYEALRQRRPDLAVHYTETDIFRHVRPDAGADWRPLLRGAGQLYRHMYHIIGVARRPPSGAG